MEPALSKTESRIKPEWLRKVSLYYRNAAVFKASGAG
jgi:hypothetical protein